MTPAIFQFSRADRCAEVGARVAVGLAGVAVIAWGVRHGLPGVLVAAGVLCGPFFWVLARQGWRSAWRIVVSGEHIEATRIGARRVRLRWDGIGEVQHFVRATIRGPIRLLRLVSIDRQREVIFNDRLLMRLVEAGVRHVGPGEPSAWGRLLWAKPAPGRRAPASAGTAPSASAAPSMPVGGAAITAPR
jgi:hypothetical protein